MQQGTWSARPVGSLALVALLGLACRGDPRWDTPAGPADDSGPAVDTSDTDTGGTDTSDSGPDTDTAVDTGHAGEPECPPDHDAYDPGALGPPPLVLFITLDALTRDYLGRFHPEWDTSPHIDALLEESTVLENVVVPRGLTLPSLSSLLTGAYPRTHGVRLNDGTAPEIEMLQERFQAAGWQTMSALGNQCSLAARGFEETFCTSPYETGNEATPASDLLLVDRVLDMLDGRDRARSSFAWVHLMSVHDPYVMVERWFDGFHPEDYTGPIEPPQEAILNSVTLGGTSFDEADRRYLDAVYASQLREVDEIVGQLLAGLEERGLLDDAIIVFGSDHGDELGLREDTRYFWHGCSVYNPVLAATYGIRAPGRVAAGEVLDGWISSVDVAPTVLELAGLDPTMPDGVSLVDDIHACENPGRPAFFERGGATGGVIAGGRKLVLDPDEGYGGCRPYNEENPYPGKRTLLFDLVEDPGELVDLSDTSPDTRTTLEGLVCDWVNDGVWESAEHDDGNPLRVACR